MNLANSLYGVWSKFYRRCTFTRVIIFTTIAVPLYNELLSYTFQGWLWSSLFIQGASSDNQIKMLFVADPQLQGNQDENRNIGFLTRWDADRYLQKSFSLAISFVQPDVVIYLGDLLDEGSKALDVEYEEYFIRFNNIFRVEPNIKQVFIPGDNDVGGEAFDLYQEWKMDRFLKHFNPDKSDVQNHKFVDFIKLQYNYGKSYDNKMKLKITDIIAKSSARIRVLLNHMGLMDRSRQEFEPLVEDTKASFIFSAHTHAARLYTCVDCHEKQTSFRWNGGIKDMKDYSIFSFRLNNDVTLTEISVPTCSYRMGVARMGFGYALLDINGEMQYTVLWLPLRYKQLYSYLFFLTVIPLVIICRWLLLKWVFYRKLNGYASR